MRKNVLFTQYKVKEYNIYIENEKYNKMENLKIWNYQILAAWRGLPLKIQR